MRVLRVLEAGQSLCVQLNDASQWVLQEIKPYLLPSWALRPW